MKRFVALSLLLLGMNTIARADHITGGEMFYTFLGRSGNNYQYSVTLKLFMRCNSGRRFNNPTVVSIFDRVTNARIRDLTVPLTKQENIRMVSNNPCITNPPTVCYDVGYYQFTVILGPSANGYLLSSQVNYRIAGINNLSQAYGLVGATYTAEIPGTSPNSDAPENNSAHFTGTDLVVVCASNSFSYSFGAEDPDGDQLRYSFSAAYVSGTSGADVTPPPPPYPPVPYLQGFSESTPLGNNVQVNQSTGLITGIAPLSGVYVVTVSVQEIRNGVVIATQRKDLQINITECTIAAASLLPEYLLCKNTTTISIANQSNSPLISSYTWQILNNSGTVLSASSTPVITYNFTDTGLYRVKLFINQGQQCSDSSSALIRVYPGLQADCFISGICYTKPSSFSDRSQTVYGTINSWYWDFGDQAAIADTSTQQNAEYTYPKLGPQNSSLAVTTSTGCRDTVYKSITILDKPPLNLGTRDTLICKGDTVQLHAGGNGIFSWTPAVNTISANTADPQVHPPATTTYVVELDDNGCKNKDSFRVRVVDFVSLAARSDTTICEKDGARLGATTDGLHFSWTPAATVDDPTRLNAIAYPAATTTYQLTASIGHCSATDNVLVNVVPYPIARAGIDTTICYNSIAQLNGITDGSTFNWSPEASLMNPTSLSPIAKPLVTTAYVLSAYDTRGCPKPGRDTVIVTVLPKINARAGNDTAVVVGEPLQLHASGGVSYVWSPSFNLSSTSTADPLAIFYEASDGLKYKLVVYNEAGCKDSAFLTIKVFQTNPVVFVPTAFTPNNDGKNDVLRPIAAGIAKIEYFRVYNRWGQMVFSTTNNGQGWDGKIEGKDQGTQSYVWQVRAIDYRGSIYVQKGVVTLIR